MDIPKWSTTSLDGEPNWREIRNRWRAIAFAEAIYVPRKGRTLSFRPTEDEGTYLGSCSSGDYSSMACCFIGDEDGVIVGFAEQSAFHILLREGKRKPITVVDRFYGVGGYPLWRSPEVTFSISVEKNMWKSAVEALPIGDDPDGSEELLGCIQLDPVQVTRSLIRRGAKLVDLELVQAIYANTPVRDLPVSGRRLIGKVNQACDECGYPW